MIDLWVLIVLKNSDISIEELFWSIEIEVKSKMTKNLLLKEDKFVFLHLLSVQIFESIDHVHEVRMLWLLEFGADQKASKSEFGGIAA